MQVPFTHPLATHPAGTILGYRTDGRPIYPIAGGSGEGEGGSGSGGSEGQGQSGQGGDGTAGQGSDQDGQQSGQGSGQSGSGSGDGDSTDWKAEARKWENRAKANHTELEKLQAANMSDQEKAVSEAEKKGRTAAASEYGAKLAAAEFRAAVAAAGIDLGEAAEYIDVNRFVGDDGEVNVAAIKSAVTKFSKLAPQGAGRSGGDMSGGSGHQAPTLEQQIAQAKADGNIRLVMRLENSKLAAAEANQQ
ncbi:hypothetical protein PV518_25030 [Streptomyces sp. ND04-05B]|uniref:hypothetical protein n=1 Tax=Streptomyces sp. ND04-05B TaxID=3028693 RepID=UPI0029B68EFE|nr:hypothetical protein [Streptomyces sp. ND04-05B]MDX3065401.1 hypothetical protein [Streptomyces sp. ND04-05B]